MKADKQTDWPKPDEDFKSIIKTRAQMRAEAQALKNQKRFKTGPEEPLIDAQTVHDNNKKITEDAPVRPEGRMQILNKFLTNRLGVSVAYQPSSDQASKKEPSPDPQDKGQPVHPSTAPPPEPTASTPSFKTQDPADQHKSDSKAQPQPASSTTLTPPPQAKAADIPSPSQNRRNSPRLEDVHMDTMMRAFRAKKAAIRALVQREGLRGRPHLPEWEKEKVRCTPNMAAKHDKTVKTAEATDLVLEHLESNARLARGSKVCEEEDMRELLDLVIDAQRYFYKAKTEAHLAKARVIVKRPNEINQKNRFRMPVLRELRDCMAKIERDLAAAEENKGVDYRAIKGDIKGELALARGQDRVLTGPNNIGEEIQRRKKEFVDRNMRGFFDSCLKLAAVVERVEEVSDSLDVLEENNRANQKQVFEREYRPLEAIIEVNGVDLFRAFIDAYPGRQGREEA